MPHKKIGTASIVLLALILGGAAATIPAAERKGCVVCGMFLDLYARTRYTITLEDGATLSTCSLECAAGILQARQPQVRDVRAADFLTGELLDARTAVYVEGSDIPGVMTFTSRLAFSTREAAQAFQKDHGGQLRSFDEAVKAQLEE